MQKLLEYTFIVCLILSIITAAILVITQLIGLVIANGDLMVQVNNLLLTPAIILAAVFSGVAFILGYFPKYKKSN